MFTELQLICDQISSNGCQQVEAELVQHVKNRSTTLEVLPGQQIL